VSTASTWFAGRAPCAATKWGDNAQEQTRDLRVGFSARARAQLRSGCSGQISEDVALWFHVVDRPDLAGDALPKVQGADINHVGGNATIVIELNEMARDQMRCEVQSWNCSGATHLFEEPGRWRKSPNSQAIVCQFISARTAPKPVNCHPSEVEESIGL